MIDNEKPLGLHSEVFCVLCYLKGMRVKCANRDVPDLATYEGGDSLLTILVLVYLQNVSKI